MQVKECMVRFVEGRKEGSKGMSEYMMLTLLISSLILTLTVTVSVLSSVVFSQHAHALTLTFTEQNTTIDDAKYCSSKQFGFPECNDLPGFVDGHNKSADDARNNRTCNLTPPPGHTVAYDLMYKLGYRLGDCQVFPTECSYNNAGAIRSWYYGYIYGLSDSENHRHHNLANRFPGDLNDVDYKMGYESGWADAHSLGTYIRGPPFC